MQDQHYRGNVLQFRPRTAPNLRHLREASPMSRRALAEMLEVSPQLLRAYELGEQPIPIKLRDDLADRFGVSVPYLLGVDEGREVA